MSRTCPYCGERDKRPGRDSCGPCDQPIKAPGYRPKLARTGRSHSTLTRQRQNPPTAFTWRGETRRW